ncbi:hypothetical protein Rhe02_80810 [Rhizocola hellebori]|uniref:Peptidase S8/S53 domain-containing protein n=1 Tax=Rhizocola hellebori TaxID=1392758 RepID=A0A8J3VK29_9ACTN|nr:S8 family serine peptidase [Rhizocola hellebori]GIH10014.1 hypothetical protein Rhe02_80810 [Rhizocola hellebori]
MMSKSKRHRFLLLGLAVVLTALPVYGLGHQEAQGTEANTVSSGALPAGKRYTVTLLTGDVVTVVTAASGCPQVSVKPAKPSGVQLRSCDTRGHARVVPAEVAPLLGSVLDEALFDVTTLIEEGYDDASTKEFPLIVRGGAVPLARSAAKALPSIGAVAVKQAKGSGLDFLNSLRAQRSAKPAGKEAGPLVRLDRRVRATAWQGKLDPNLPQVSAPQAWADGFTGSGVKVAVLDTGADFSHPDLAGQVAERADFTVEGGTAADGHGHGTHVAAIIAGTGAAASGERRGVAPGAQLVVGKVLDDDGFGSESQIIAGMEWAATRAKVINMSLGGWEPSDGTDPMSMAVNALTAQHGTLFVIAAGNEGVDNYITSPAAAADALTVGAVDFDDQVAWFSSRGPLINTRAAKPELVAPGVEVVAARAAGTGLGRIIDSRYTSLSGTSMAAPHAAAGAAILSQRHPDWTPAQLKSALVGAVDPLPGADTYVTGAGRLNVARALTGATSAQPIVHLGVLPHPQTGTAQTDLSWNDTGGRLRFEVTATDRGGSPAPAGSVSFDGRTLKVDRARFADRFGSFTAVVTARTSRGALVSTTPVTFFIEPPTVDLTLSATPLPGSTSSYDMSAWAHIVNLDDPALFDDGTNVDPWEGPVVMRVPAGRYSVISSFIDFSTGAAAIVGDPDVVVTTDTALLLDAANAKPVKGAVEGVDTVANQVGLTTEQTARRGWMWWEWAYAWGADAARDSVFAGPVQGVSVGKFDLFASFSLLAPGDQPSPFVYDLIQGYGNVIPGNLSFTLSRAEQAKLSRIDQRFHRLDKQGSQTYHKRYGVSPSGVFVLEEDTGNLPPTRIDYLSPGYRYVDEAFYDTGVSYAVGAIEARHTYAPGSRQEKVWIRQPLHSDWYDDPSESTSGCVPYPIRRTREQLRVELVNLADQHQRFNCGGLGKVTQSLTLHRDGQLLGEFAGSAGQFTIPAAAGTYRLTYDLDAGATLPVSTRVTTAWTFRSAAPKGTDDAPLALLSVDYALALDQANHPVDGRSSFTVRQAHGVSPQRIASFALSVSLDDGVTWQTVTVRRDGPERFSAQLPRPAAGQAVSLKVKADGAAGSAIEQTIIRAYG